MEWPVHAAAPPTSVPSSPPWNLFSTVVRTLQQRVSRSEPFPVPAPAPALAASLL